MSLRNTTESPEPKNTPAPYRAIYGFVLWLVSYVFLMVYIVWAFISEEYLHFFGLTYWPQKYWAIAIPAYIFTAFLIFGLIIYPSVNLLITPPLCDVRTIQINSTSAGTQGIAPVVDIKLTDVCGRMYL